MRALLFAVSFLTRLPLPADVHKVSDRTLARGPLWFPLVGGFIGAGTGLVVLGLGQLLSGWVAVLLALAVEARLTGAMHEDALADSFDAIGGGWSRQRTLEIFKDSRLGTYGVLALGLVVAVRAATNVDLLDICTDPSGLGASSFVAMMALAGFSGRLLMLVFLKVMPPLKSRQSLTSGFGVGLDWPSMALAGLPIVGLAFWVGGQKARAMGFALILSILLLLLGYRQIGRRLGGSTGDVLGAIAYLGQLLVLIALSSSL